MVKPPDCLKIYDNADFYDAQHVDFDEDLEFYLKKAKEIGPPILELACGTGRLTIPIAELGLNITGLDVSAPMLARARQKAEDAGVDVTWVKADCRDFDLGKTFKFIFIPFNSFNHIWDLESAESCLTSVRGHLDSDGIFLIDIYNPKLEILTRDPSQRYPVFKHPNPIGEGKVTITENSTYDPATQINYVKWYFKIEGEDEEVVEELTQRVWFPQEIDGVLKYSGFEIVAKYGDFDESSFESRSPKQIIVCRKR